jgi:2-keto-4-pentenoate hydratase/2-oxohepta-3-ene-1,7-dioic acid hydratase in catechol pathway
MTRWLAYANRTGGAERVGLVMEDNVHGVEPGPTLGGLIAAGEPALAAAARRATEAPAEVVPLADVEILPLLKPPVLRDAMSFHEHIRNCFPGSWDERHEKWPYFWIGNASTVIGAKDDVHLYPETSKFDYELEVGAVLGRGGMNLSADDAEDAILGYTIFCDWSARDLQFDRPAMIKGKDGATTLGPFLVTKDEIENRRSGLGFDISMTVRRNGTQFTQGNWSSINWSFPDVVSYASRGATLMPGDVIGSGTVGWGCLLEHERADPENFPGWLVAGDRLEFEIEGLGKLEHTILPAIPVPKLSNGF